MLFQVIRTSCKCFNYQLREVSNKTMKPFSEKFKLVKKIREKTAWFFQIVHNSYICPIQMENANALYLNHSICINHAIPLAKLHLRIYRHDIKCYSIVIRNICWECWMFISFCFNDTHALMRTRWNRKRSRESRRAGGTRGSVRSRKWGNV